jgi:PKD domain
MRRNLPVVACARSCAPGSIRLAVAAVAALITLGWFGSPASASSGNLSYGGGPVVHSSAPYLVFWVPNGESIPASSQALMARFFADVAADSGKATNVFGALRQFYDRHGFADYRERFNPTRQLIVDQQPYPPQDAGRCPDVSNAYPTCISDVQIQSELERLISASGLPTAGKAGRELVANAPIYFVILPGDAAFCHGDHCTDRNLSAYHDEFADARGDAVLYAAIAMNPEVGVTPPPGIKGTCRNGGTDLPQEPNGDLGDCAINRISHELSETLTDPVIPTGWSVPGSMAETADECGLYGPFDPAEGFNPNAYLPTLGGSAAAGTLYDQLINGHPYYLQSEWSNGQHNCVQRAGPGRITPRFTTPRGPNTVGSDLSFNPSASTSRNGLSSATWTFGDGSRPAFLYRHGHAILTRVTHRYRSGGRYTITLTLVDNHGNLQSTTRRATIRAR